MVSGAEAGGARLERPAVVPATDEEIQRIHPAWFVASLDAAASRGGGWIDADTYLSTGSMQVSRLAAGATLAAARAATRGEAEVAFAVVRPPGHHAFEEATHGFCLLNNVAIAVAGLRRRGWRTGSRSSTGTCITATARRPSSRPMRTSAMPRPTSRPSTRGPATRRSGARALPSAPKHNVPLPAGSGDRAFIEAWTVQLLPAIEAFAPEAILVSAGYDAHHHDPLAMLEVTEAGYEAVAAALGELTTRLGQRGVALTLEGGYDLDASSAAPRRHRSGLLRGLSGGA